MSEKTISAGDEIDSYCASCKLVLAHRVVALVEGKVERVICKTCQKRHKYRPNPPKSMMKKATTRKKKASGSKAKTTKKKRTVRRRSKDPAVIWEEALAGKDVSFATPYSMNGLFKQEEVIDHNMFGVGFVSQLLGDDKMEVLFKEGAKILVYNRESI